MAQSRVERGATRRQTRRKVYAVLAVVALVAGVGAAALVFAETAEKPERIVASVEETMPYSPDARERTEDSSSEPDVAFGSSASREFASTSATPLVEIPDVVGRTGAEAATLLKAAGLVLAASPDPSGKITGQEPGAGSVVASGTVITLVVDASNVQAAAKKTSQPAVVCIDPGHQARSDTKKEPVGPGSAETKPRVAGGATGVATRIPEYEIALQISMNLKRRLEAAGIKVVMTRTTNDVNLSNAERAQIANAAKAALFVRVHANGSTDPKAAGVSTLYPGDNKWTRQFAEKSKQAAEVVQRAVLTSTGAPNDGVKARTDLAGFNWSQVPCVLVECGYLSNPVEDKLLASPQYQDKVAMGMATGVLRYLGR